MGQLPHYMSSKPWAPTRADGGKHPFLSGVWDPGGVPSADVGNRRAVGPGPGDESAVEREQGLSAVLYLGRLCREPRCIARDVWLALPRTGARKRRHNTVLGQNGPASGDSV
eukprot:3698410-Rhodomonas_salina.2